MATELRCVGCGARNQRELPECQWCGRRFASAARRSRWRAPVVVAAALGLVVCALFAGVGFALLQPAAPLAEQPSAQQLVPSLAGAPAPPAVPTAEPESEAAEVVETAEAPPEFVRVANTNGQGISLRREPGVLAPRVVARAENVVLQVVGPDAMAEGRVWRQVQDPQGNRGWAPADFLLPVPGSS